MSVLAVKFCAYNRISDSTSTPLFSACPAGVQSLIKMSNCLCFSFFSCWFLIGGNHINFESNLLLIGDRESYRKKVITTNWSVAMITAVT